MGCDPDMRTRMSLNALQLGSSLSSSCNRSHASKLKNKHIHMARYSNGPSYLRARTQLVA